MVCKLSCVAPGWSGGVSGFLQTGASSFEHSDWPGLPAWPAVARARGCYRAVAWVLEQVIFATSWTELFLHWS